MAPVRYDFNEEEPGLSELIIDFIGRWSYFGIALLMALENIFPPIPSELIMPFAGYVAARGDLNIAGVVVAGVLGSLAGTLPWYWLGRSIGRERLARWVGARGRWFTISPEELERAERWFLRRGGWALLAGRLVPAVRSVISMPAGVAAMPLPSMLAWSACGTLLWTGMLAGLGFALESRYERIAGFVDKLSMAVVILLVVSYAWRVIRFRPGPR